VSKANTDFCSLHRQGGGVVNYPRCRDWP